MNYDKYLPIGTVVLLKNATKRLMIVGFCVKGDTDDKIYDYVGCLYSEEEKEFKEQLNSLIGSN